MKSSNPLDKIAEQVFWDEFNQRRYEEERYIVVNTRTGDVLVKNARLTKEKKVTKV